MPDKFQIILPWPTKALSPNARVHWSKKAKAAERYRYDCKMTSLEYIRAGKWDMKALSDLVAGGYELHVFIDFYPPNRRARDDDNVIAAFKSGRDGLADALGIDDCHFQIHPFLKRDDVVVGGEVRVVITTKGPSA